jgi:UDP-glucuronate 4-epimerase
MKVLVTGVAGFIGFHVAKALLNRGDTVIGIDNINDYYDVKLKQGRLDDLTDQALSENFTFLKMDISSRDQIELLFLSSVT